MASTTTGHIPTILRSSPIVFGISKAPRNTTTTMYDLRIPKRFQEGQAYQEYVQALEKAKNDPYFTAYTHVPMEEFYRFSGIDPRPAVKILSQQTDSECNDFPATTDESENGEDTLVPENDSDDTLVLDSIRTSVGCGLCSAEVEGNKPFSWDDVDIPEDAYHVSYQFAERKGLHAFLGYAYYTAEGERVDVKKSQLCDEHAPRAQLPGVGSGTSNSGATAVAESATGSSTAIGEDEGEVSNRGTGEMAVDENGHRIKHWCGTRDDSAVADKTANSTAAKTTELEVKEEWERRGQTWANMKPGSKRVPKRQPRSHW